MKYHDDYSTPPYMKQLLKRRKSILQRLVFISRRIDEIAGDGGNIPPDLLSELQTLIREADQAGIHGCASAQEETADSFLP